MKKLKYWYYLKYKGLIHPEQMLEILKEIKKTYTKTLMGIPPNWELRKFKIAAEYALNEKSMEQIAEEYNVTRERVKQIQLRIYWDYKKGLYSGNLY